MGTLGGSGCGDVNRHSALGPVCHRIGDGRIEIVLSLKAKAIELYIGPVPTGWIFS